MSDVRVHSIFGDKDRLRLDLPGGAYLRAVGGSDVTALYVDGLNDPAVNKFMTAVREQRQTVDTVTAYVAANRAAPDDCLFGIFIDEILRGTVRLHDASPSRGTVTMGVVLFDRRVWGKGWGTRAIDRAAGFALTDLNLEEVRAGVYAGNPGSQKAFERAGFVLASAPPPPVEPYTVLTYHRTGA